MSQRCEIVGRVVYDNPGSVAGTARAVYECVTHGMPVASMHLPGSELCPIGRIEAATEAALAKIEAARNQ